LIEREDVECGEERERRNGEVPRKREREVL
jgi:hypothetical protein